MTNFETYLKYPAIMLTAFLLTYLLVPVVRALGRRAGMLDMPRERHLHTTPVPRCGGVAVFFGFHGACAVAFLLPWMTFSGQLTFEHWINMLILSSSLILLGILDDRIELWSIAKLAGQFILAIAAYYLGFRAGSLVGFELPRTLDLILTVAWFVGIMNAFNLVDGIDGLATGLAIVASLGLAGNLILQRSTGDVLILLALLGACLAFLRYNFHPATIFLGDSGSMFLGFILAAVALGTGNKGTAMASLIVPLLAFGIPLFDTLLAIWRRAIRGLPAYSGASPVSSAQSSFAIMEGDRDHLHHRLLKEGLSQKSVAVCLYLAGFAIVAAGLLSRIFENRGTGIFLVAFLVFAYVVMRHLATIELWDSGVVLVRGIRRPPRKVLAAIYYPVMDIVLLTAVFSAALYLAKPWAFSDYKLAVLDGTPVWVGIPFLTLFAARCYKRVWSRARLLDYVIVGAANMGGILIAAAFVIIFGNELAYNLPLLVVVLAAAAPLCLTATRAMPRVVFEYMALARRQETGAGQHDKQVLLYGAGFNCTLFLRAVSFNPVVERDGYNITGVLDDDSNLHGRFVYGYKVFGGINDLEQLVRSRKIDKIIVTTRKLTTSCQRKLRRIAAELGLSLLEWEAGVVPVTAIKFGSGLESAADPAMAVSRFQALTEHKQARNNVEMLPNGQELPASFLRRAFKEQVERELGRSARHDHTCALAVFSVARENAAWALEMIGSMLRLDDSSGLADDAGEDRPFLKDANAEILTVGVLLPETGEAGATRAVDRIYKKLNGGCLSYGWAEFPRHGKDYMSLMAVALRNRRHQEKCLEQEAVSVFPALDNPVRNTVLTSGA